MKVANANDSLLFQYQVHMHGESLRSAAERDPFAKALGVAQRIHLLSLLQLIEARLHRKRLRR